MTIQIARVPTQSGSRYLQQLCKHWSHKLEVEFSPTDAIVYFPDAVARMNAKADHLEVSVEAADTATTDRLSQVLSSHLDRFAFREAPLSFDWVQQAA